MSNQADFSLEKPIHRLLTQEPFFAHFLLGARIILDMPGVPTAGAGIRNGKIMFVINTDFFRTLNVPEQAAVMKHEIMHVLLEHVAARADKNDKYLANVAMDCAINQHLHDLPAECITLTKVNEFCGKELEAEMTYEYYLAALKLANAKKQKEAGDSVSNHEFMNGDEADIGDEMSEQQKRAVIGHAAKQAISAARGNVPHYLQKDLAALQAGSKLSWKQLLRNIISSTRVAENRNTRKKLHRRFDLDQPGKRRKKRLTVGVCVDSSGSVSDAAFSAFMSEVYSISKNTAMTYLVDADSEVHKVTKIKGTAKVADLGQRYGRGGTAYQPAITECKKLSCDLIIYFGDMDSADVPADPGVPFVWVRVGTQSPPAKFGKVVDLDL